MSYKKNICAEDSKGLQLKDLAEAEKKGFYDPSVSLARRDNFIGGRNG